MGFGLQDFRFLLSAIDLGFTGKDICTLGHLTFYGSQRSVDSVLREFDRPTFALPKNKSLYFAEDLMNPLGFRVDALDASPYEGANIIHDLNLPIPDHFSGRYDLVIDGGTLEHVFNFPVAISNVMKLVKTGGDIFLFTPANNQCGHGFYQFSPELFFRIFAERNGFELLRLYISTPSGTYHVIDPAVVHGRVQLLNSEGTMIMVHARKIAERPFTAPQQSDYVEEWQRSDADKPTDGRLKSYLRSALSQDRISRISLWLNHLRVRRGARLWKKQSRLSNRELYRPVTDWRQKTADAFASN